MFVPLHFEFISWHKEGEALRLIPRKFESSLLQNIQVWFCQVPEGSVNSGSLWITSLRFFRTNSRANIWHKPCLGSSCGKEFPWETHSPSTTTEAEARLFPRYYPLWHTSWVTLWPRMSPSPQPLLQTVALSPAPKCSPLALKSSSLQETNRCPLKGCPQLQYFSK